MSRDFHPTVLPIDILNLFCMLLEGARHYYDRFAKTLNQQAVVDIFRGIKGVMNTERTIEIVIQKDHY
ncbi:hypothetical protein B5X24_HaOG213712 [Helicoverpa armigera]|nr:hypothetical protein B5X24_HaOG213712 [Helicoverpa armigera]